MVCSSITLFFFFKDLLQFSEGKIKELGVRNSAHRARIVSSLVILKNKYEKCGGELKNFNLLTSFFGKS